MDANEIIRNYEGWLFKVAGQILTPTHPNLDDLVQEGRVALWHALQSWDPAKGSQPSWLTLKANHRMVEVATGRKWTGQPSRLHGRYSAEELPMDSLERHVSGNPAAANALTIADIVPDPSATADMERAELALARAEIAAARRNLTPAQQLYVAARFYAQLSDREMQEQRIFTYDPHALWTSPKNGARGKLAAELAHLREADC